MNHSRKKEDGNAADVVRITSQFRTRDGMAYELCDHEVRLTVVLTEDRQGEEDGRWRVEAYLTQQPTRRVDRAGPTRREAVVRAGSTWRLDATHGALPAFDWDGAARVLALVRAI